MAIFTNLYKKRPPEERPIVGEPPLGLMELEALVRIIRESGQTCDHTCKQIKTFLQDRGIEVELVLRWLHRAEIYCDCALLNAYHLGTLPQPDPPGGLEDPPPVLRE